MVVWFWFLAAAWASPPVEGAVAEPEPESGEAAPAAAASVKEQRTYAMRQTFTSQMRNPNPFSNGGWKSTRTDTWALVRWNRDGTRVRYTEKTCDVATAPVFGAETIYTPAFIRAIDLRKRTATLVGEGDTPRFIAGPYHQSFGVELDNPMTDELPRDPDDPRIRDSDKDGEPGTTVVIRHPMMGEGRVYVAQRSVARLEGRLLPSGEVRGVIFTSPDMFKIDADKWWLRKDAPQRQHPSPKESPFIMVPVDDDMDCERLLASRSSIFPSHEELGASADP